MAPEEKHLAWPRVQGRVLEERLCFAKGLVVLTSCSRGDWHSRQRESKQKEKMQISMAGCVTEGSSAKLE